jgi:ABC-2 type transport system permease protein
MVDESLTRSRPTPLLILWKVWGSTVMRLLRLWRFYATMDLLWMMRDLPTLLMFFLSDAIIGVATVTGTFLLAERFGGIGRWTQPQIIFLLGYALLVGGLPDIFFNYNVAFISRRIGRGQLDHTLVQPQPIWMALLTEGFSPFSAAMTLVPGCVVLGWAIVTLRIAPTPAWLGLLLLNLAASMAIGLAYAVLWGSLAFWAPRAAEEINSSTSQLMTQLAPFPLDAVAPVMLGALLSVVPAGLLAWLPARALLGIQSGGFSPFLTPIAAVILCALAAWVFRKGLDHYARTGSQRYLSLGHRS